MKYKYCSALLLVSSLTNAQVFEDRPIASNENVNGNSYLETEAFVGSDNEGNPLLQISSNSTEEKVRFVEDQLIIKLNSPVSISAVAIEPSVQAGVTNNSVAVQEETSFEKLLASQNVKSINPLRVGTSNEPASTGAQVNSLLPQVTSEYFILEFDTGVVNERSIKKIIDAFEQDSQVIYAEPNYLIKTHAVPNDPYFDTRGAWENNHLDLWGISSENNFPDIWDISQGDGVIVAVIDTGVDINHEDLAENIWVNDAEIPNNGIDDDNNGFIDDTHGWDFVGESIEDPIADNNPNDAYGHGTHVAGTVAAIGDNEIGVIGVAPKAKIMPIKSLDDDGRGTLVDIVDGINYAVENGAHVVNMSLGFMGRSDYLKDTIQNAHNAGVVMVVSAGNSSLDAVYNSPANIPEVITVGADFFGEPADFSNTGIHVDVFAPGREILSLNAEGSLLGEFVTVVDEKYSVLSGTSMASPYIAGVVALLLEVNPLLRPEQIRYIVNNSAQVWTPRLGFGNINVFSAVQMAASQEAIPNVLATISSPFIGDAYPNSTFAKGVVQFEGRAIGSDFNSYSLAYARAGETNFTPFYNGRDPVEANILGSLDSTALENGAYTIRLSVEGSNNRVNQYFLNIDIDQSIKTGWPKAMHDWRPFSGYAHSPHGLAFEDVDGDSQKEIVGSENGNIFILDENAEEKLWIPVETYAGPRINFPIATNDIDNDGVHDLVYSVRSEYQPLSAFFPKTMAVNSEGRELPGFPAGYDMHGNISEPVSQTVSTDIDYDGFVETIAVFSRTNFGGGYRQSRELAIFNSDGSVKEGWPLEIRPLVPARIWVSGWPLAVSDLDGDGQKEIVTSSSDESTVPHLVVYSPNGEIMLDIVPDPEEKECAFDACTVISTLYLVDMNNDGRKEILFNLYDYSRFRLTYYLYDLNGELVDGWPRSPRYSEHPYAAYFADHNNDGALDLHIPAATFERDLRVVVYDYQGSMIATNTFGDEGEGWGEFTSAVVKNSENGRMYSIIGYGESIFTLDENLNELPEYTKRLSNAVDGINIADLGGDGISELGVFSNDGLIHMWEAPHLDASEPALWSTKDGNNQRTRSVEVTNDFQRNYPTMYLRSSASASSNCSGWGAEGMSLVSDNTWQINVTFNNRCLPEFKFDALGDWSENWGDTDKDGIGDSSGANIQLVAAGEYIIRFNDETREYSAEKINPDEGYRRTTVFIYHETVSGQDVFMRGGIDFKYSEEERGVTCSNENRACYIAIHHINKKRMERDSYRYDGWLDWRGAEPGQGDVFGSPLTWTTNQDDYSRSVAKDGSGYEPLNRWGRHYWMLDVMMDCSSTVDNWFEFKTYMTNGTGWESDINQFDITNEELRAPYRSNNHFGQCGKLNVYQNGEDSPTLIEEF